MTTANAWAAVGSRPRPSGGTDGMYDPRHSDAGDGSRRRRQPNVDGAACGHEEVGSEEQWTDVAAEQLRTGVPEPHIGTSSGSLRRFPRWRDHDRMPKATVWRLEPHTKAKHELLRRYLGAWFPILTVGGFNRRVLFLDGFAGPGIYENGEPGSPIIAVDTLVAHRIFDDLNHTEFVFIFVEPDPERFTSLEAELAKYWAARLDGQPANVKVQTFNDTFEAVQPDAGVHTGAEDATRPNVGLRRPVRVEGRWVTDERPGIARHFDALFGTTHGEHRAAANLEGDARRTFLRYLYKRQLATVGGFTHVRSFELMDLGRGRTAYYLMFGTRHHLGLKVMKEAMWALDPAGGTRFSGFAGGQQMLFGDVDTSPLRGAMLTKFAGHSVSVDTIERFVIEETDFKTTHFKKQVLKPLEAEDISCASRRRGRLWAHTHLAPSFGFLMRCSILSNMRSDGGVCG